MNEPTENAGSCAPQPAQFLAFMNLRQPSRIPPDGRESCVMTDTTGMLSVNFGLPVREAVPVQQAEPRAPGALYPVFSGQNPAYNFPQTNYGTHHQSIHAADPNAPANSHSISVSPSGTLLPPQMPGFQMPPFQIASSNPQISSPLAQMPTFNPQMQPSQMLPSQILPLQTPTLNPQIQPSWMPVQLVINSTSNPNCPISVNEAASSGYRPPLPISPIRVHGWISNDLLLQNSGPRPTMTASTLFGYYSDINELLRISNPNWQTRTTHTEDCFNNAYSLLCSFHMAYESDDKTDIWFNSWLGLQLREVADCLRSDMIEKFCCRGHGKLRMQALARVCPHETNCATYRAGLEGCSWREQWDVDMLIGSKLYRKAKAAEDQLKQRAQQSSNRKLEDTHARQLQRDISLLERITSDTPTAHLQHMAYIQQQNQREEELNARILQLGCELIAQQEMEGLRMPSISFNNQSSFPASSVSQIITPAQLEAQPQIRQPEGWPPQNPIPPITDPPRGLGMADLEATELSL
ncbi:hypothetical protein BGX38DRAFT_1152902, partial [Terfezia claveryi]